MYSRDSRDPIRPLTHDPSLRLKRGDGPALTPIVAHPLSLVRRNHSQVLAPVNQGNLAAIYPTADGTRHLTALSLDEKLQLRLAELLRNVRPPRAPAVQPQTCEPAWVEYEYRSFR